LYTVSSCLLDFSFILTKAAKVAVFGPVAETERTVWREFCPAG